MVFRSACFGFECDIFLDLRVSKVQKLLIFLKKLLWRFIYLKNKKQALEILNNIAKINKKAVLPDDALEERDDQHVKQRLDNRKYTIVDLFKYKSLRVPTLILIFAHFFVELFYWGTGFALPSLGTSIYLNIFLFGVIEMASYLAAGY